VLALCKRTSDFHSKSCRQTYISFALPALLQFGSEFEVHFSLCGHEVSMKFEVLKKDIPSGGAPLGLDQVRMSWFFSSDEGISIYLRKQTVMEFSIFNCETREQFAAMKIDLSDLANKIALQQSIRVPIEPTHKDLTSVFALQYAYLHINIGCIKFREVDASSFRLRRRHGLFLPSTPFVTGCLPPDGWDPCNEKYIREFANGSNFLEKDATALTMDGALIPRSRKIQHLLQAELADDDADSFSGGDSQKSVSQYMRLSDGIAPAPIWQRKNHGELPPKYPGSGRPPRPLSAPLDTNKTQGRLKSRTRAASASQLRVSSPSASVTPGKRRPSSSPIKRSTPSPFSRPSSSLSRPRASESLTPTRSRVKRPESAPPRADRAIEMSAQRGRSAAGRGSASAVYQSPSIGGSGARRPTSAVRRPASAKVPDRRPSSALAAARQRPNSALGKMPNSGDSKPRSPTSRSWMAPRPDSAMSNIAPSSADECDIIDTIDELDQAEWERGISPFEFRDSSDAHSDGFGFLRTSSTASAISGNFGVHPSHRRPASAMAAAGRIREEETEEANAQVLAVITRPRSAATSKTAKCVEGLRNQVPSFQSACAVSKLAELAGKRSVRSTDILTNVETNHKAWRSNITEISMLDNDLKALDARSRLVSFRERAQHVVPV